MMENTNPALAKAQGDRHPCYLITVDTEGDNLWARPERPATANSRFLPRFQALCESYRLKPTYLTNFEMATCPIFREFGCDILKRGTGEIGMHLHAWDSPPLVPLTANDRRNHPYLIEYPEAVMRDKIAFMTDLLEETFGVKMTSHRAGRWGFNSAYAKILAEKGYLADCSVTPHVSWSQHSGDPMQKGGPDYSNFPELPYFMDLDDISKTGNSKLLEIPVTSMDVRPPLIHSIARRLAHESLPHRALNRLFPAICWLNPIQHGVKITLRVVERAAAERRICVQAFHSSEFMPGGSPRYPGDDDIEALYDDLHRVFEMASKNFKGATVTEFRSEFSGDASPSASSAQISAEIAVVGTRSAGATPAMVPGQNGRRAIPVDPGSNCPQPDVPVVVVAGTLNSLGVIRSLSFGRMPIYVVATTRSCAAGWSRFCTFVRVPSLEGRGLIDSLTELGSRLGHRPVLILTGDQCVKTVSTYRDEIETLYRISLPSAEVVHTLADKILFQMLAEREGFAVPRGIPLEATSDLSLLQHLTPPLVIKAADKAVVLDSPAERAVRANTLAEARTTIGRMLEHTPRVIVQEWIDGPDSEIFFALFSCDRHSNLIGIFSGRKLVCSPPEIGNTAVCVAAPEASAEMRALVLNFIARVGYRGLGSLEFKRDRRTGRLIIIEPTVGRTDWQEEIATLCGVNLPLITYWAELGRTTAEVNARPVNSVAWRSSIEYQVPPGVLLPGTRVIDGFFRCSDPVPAFYYYGLERFATRIVRRAARLFSSRRWDAATENR